MKRKKLNYIMRNIYRLLLLIIVFSLGVTVGVRHANPIDYVLELSNKENTSASLYENIPEDELVDFTPFWFAWNTLNNRYMPHGTSTEDLQIIDAQAKVWSAISGLADAYNDPYTVFLPPEESENFKISTNGTFEGVGMRVGQENNSSDGQLIVVQPMPNSPAEKAGVLANDKIILIDFKIIHISYHMLF